MGPPPHQRNRTFYHSKFSASDHVSLPRPFFHPSLLTSKKEGSLLPLQTFTKDDYKNAKLRCQTKADCSSVNFGFTAESVFYTGGILQVQSTTFSHHQQSLQIMASRDGLNLKIELRYGLFSQLNFEIRLYGKTYYIIKLTVVASQTPLFYKADRKPDEAFTRFTRFNPEKQDTSEFWKKFIASTAFQMAFVLDESELFSFLDSLSSTASCSILFSPLKDRVFNSYRMDYYFQTEMKKWPWNIRYVCEAIKSCGDVGMFLMDYVLFEKNEHLSIKDKGILNESWALRMFSAVYDFLKSDISLSSLEFCADNYEQPQKRDDGFVMIKTVYITPTRTILTLEEASMNCRGFRKIGVDSLIQIKFRDDSLTWFPNDDFLLKDVVKRICREGIDIAGRKFLEFGGSSSLFREHGSYFYATEDKDEIIEKWQTLGEFKVEAAAKVQARLGQYFTSAREIRFKLRQSHVCLIDDYMSTVNDSANKPYCFSDGCGMIDPIFARRIADELQLAYVPSAFQFRFAGFKGMVAVDYHDSRLTNKDGPYFLLLRHSQKKFHVEDNGELLDFDVVQWSAPTPSKLHGAFIAMIDALAIYNKQQDNVRARLRQLHNETFVDIIKPLTDKKAFLATLEKLPKYVPVYKMKTKNLLHQPFLRGMIEANAVLNARLLANKCQIAIPPDLGRGALGIVDTTGSLKEGEIFFQFSSSVNSKSLSAEFDKLDIGGVKPVLKVGRVGVTKSPIYHVGDIRYLQAVEAPALMDKVDVIVFPSVGTRPHTDEIGGGDIDGDWYTVFWDQAFLLECPAEPNDYTAPSVDEIKKVDLHGLQEDAADIRVRYMKSNNLEQLSTTHLAHLTLHDPLHQDCEKLARKADKAVNFFKSGLEAEELEEHERPGYWPKFMGKAHEPGYTNYHILSELHEKSTSILHLISIAQREAQQNREKSGLIDMEDVVITESDKKMFIEYKKAINAIKVRYQIKSEGELFSNAIVHIPGVLKNYKDPMGDDGCPSALVQRKVFEVFEKFRTRILNRFAPHCWRTEMEMNNENVFTYKIPAVPKEMIQLAKTFYAMAEDDGECYSFPWLLWEGLDIWWSQSISEKSDETNLTDEKPLYDLVSSDQSTLISRAFFPQNEHLSGIKLHEQTITYPPFVVSIPVFWSKKYEHKYKILEKLSGCEQVVTEKRKTLSFYVHYTIMCRGTLKACQKLESMLTPVIKMHDTKSIRETKRWKGKVMQHLLMKTFGFQHNLQRKNSHQKTYKSYQKCQKFPY